VAKEEEKKSLHEFSKSNSCSKSKSLSHSNKKLNKINTKPKVDCSANHAKIKKTVNSAKYEKEELKPNGHKWRKLPVKKIERVGRQ
jgi:hypothetical protein